MNQPAGRIWIQGAGELGSGVALRLVRSGYRVIMAEIPRPLAVRRLVCFSEAVYWGRAQVEEVSGQLVELPAAVWLPGRVTVVIDEQGQGIPRLRPEAIVDARMLKRVPEPLPRAEVPLVGLGPGFRIGRDADLIVETHRRARMGAVLTAGEAAANTGIPGPIGGQTARRVVRSPAEGCLRPSVAIGDLVQEGQVLGHVAGKPVCSDLTGLVRGLVHEKAELSKGVKVADIDPRGATVNPALVTDKALAVAGGVLEALLRLGILPATAGRADQERDTGY